MNQFISKKHGITEYINLVDEGEGEDGADENSNSNNNKPITSNKAIGLNNKESSPDASYPMFINCIKGKPMIDDESKLGFKANLRYDIIRKIKEVKRYKDTQILLFKVSFRKRPSGVKPSSRWCSNALLKMYAPLQLAEFYESKLNKINTT